MMCMEAVQLVYIRQPLHYIIVSNRQSHDHMHSSMQVMYLVFEQYRPKAYAELGDMDVLRPRCHKVTQLVYSNNSRQNRYRL